MVTCEPSRGSLIPRCSFWATTSRMRSASLLARALSATGRLPFFLFHVQKIWSPEKLVVVAVQAPSHGQQLHLGPPGDQPLALVQYVGDVPHVTRHRRESDAGPPVQVQVVHLGRAHRVLPLEFG